MNAKFESVLMKLAVMAGGLMIPGMAHAACTYQLTYTYNNVPSSGGGNWVQVITQNGCPWSIAGGSSWLTLPASRTGTGSQLVLYSVAPNYAHTTRTAYMNVYAGHSFGGNVDCGIIGGRNGTVCPSGPPRARLTFVQQAR